MFIHYMVFAGCSGNSVIECLPRSMRSITPKSSHCTFSLFLTVTLSLLIEFLLIPMLSKIHRKIPKMYKRYFCVHRKLCTKINEGKYMIMCVCMRTHTYMHIHTYVWVNTIELMFRYTLFKEALLFMKVCYCSLWSPHFIAVLYSTRCIFNVNSLWRY